MRRKSNFKIVSVDIGINALGYAIWRDNKELEAPLEAGIIKVPNKLIKNLWQLKIEWLLSKFEVDVLSYTHHISLLVLEWPNIRSGAVGRAASDDVLHLAYAAGYHAQQATQRGINILLAPVMTWKGNLSKEIVNTRIQRAIGNKDQKGGEFKSHAYDAVGIGLWAKGFHINDKVFAKE